MNHRVLVSILSVLACSTSFCAAGRIVAGPMLGHQEHCEVLVWRETEGAGRVELSVRPAASDAPSRLVPATRSLTDPIGTHVHHFVVDGLVAGHAYSYAIMLDGTAQPAANPLTFRAKSQWEWRGDPPVVRFLVGSCSYINDPPYDRSSGPTRPPYGASPEIFRNMAKHGGDFMRWRGDNLYLREQDWSSRYGIFSAKPLPDPIPLRIQFPISRETCGRAARWLLFALMDIQRCWRRVTMSVVSLVWAGGAAAAEPPTKLVFQMDLGVKNVQFAGLLVAEREGFYRAAGLDVEIRRLGKGPSDYASVAATVAATEGMVGSIESGLFLAGRAAGLPIVALGAMFQETPLGLMSFRAKGIRTPRDLAGKTVAVHGDGHEALDAVLQRAGLNRTQLTVTKADYDNAPLLAGKYDAKQGYLVDELIKLQVEGHDIVALPFGANGYAAYSQVYFVSEMTLRKHRAALVRFIAASNRGWRAALADGPGTAKFVVEKHEPQLALDYQTRSLAAIGPLLTAESPQLGVTTPETWLRNAGAFLSSQPNAKLGEMARWVDFSVAAEAAKLAP